MLVKSLRRSFLLASILAAAGLSGVIACTSEEESAEGTGASAQVDDSLDLGAGERKIDGEDESIANAKKLVTELMKKKQAARGKAEPANHASLQGCMRATFEVRQVNATLGVGFFKTPAIYNSWIQFSNADGVMSGRKGKDDHEGVLRGVAIKVMGVHGERQADDGATTQDFIMNNRPYFYWKNINVMSNLLTVVSQPDLFSKASEFGSAIVGHGLTIPVLHGLRLDKADKNVIANPLEERYWSRLPVGFGLGKAMKYGMWRHSCDSSDPVWTTIPDALEDHTPAIDPTGLPSRYLRDAMKSTLAQDDVCFDFAIQRQTNPVDMPVEDEDVRWTHKKAPYEVVARVRIPKQDFDQPNRDAFCSNLSFSPFHGLAEHRPLGNLNRGRHVLEKLSSKYRHDAEGKAEFEPTEADLPVGEPAFAVLPALQH